MDERLIEIVKEFPCLWDTNSEFYKSTEAKDAAWRVIIKKAKIKDVPTAKCRWKQLRDNHRDALKRQNGTRGGTGRRQIKSWKYQNVMSFLVPHMSNIEPISNFVCLEYATNDSSNESNTNNHSQEISVLPSILPSTTNSLASVSCDDSTASGLISTASGLIATTSGLASTPRKRKNDEILDLLSKSQENRDLFRQELREIINTMWAKDKFDETDSFFLNLAASTKKLPYHLQLQIKRNCFNAVIAAEESNLQQSATISNNTASSSNVEENEVTTD